MKIKEKYDDTTPDCSKIPPTPKSGQSNMRGTVSSFSSPYSPDDKTTIQNGFKNGLTEQNDRDSAINNIKSTLNSNCVPDGMKDKIDNINTDITGGLYGAIQKNTTLDDKIKNYCQGGPGETMERARLIYQGIETGMAGFQGTSDIVGKSYNLAFGGSTDFQSMPNEIQKSLANKLDMTKDYILYTTTCKNIEIDKDLLKLIQVFDKETSVLIQSVQDELGFQIAGLGIGTLMMSVVIITIVFFLLFY